MDQCFFTQVLYPNVVDFLTLLFFDSAVVFAMPNFIRVARGLSGFTEFESWDKWTRFKNDLLISSLYSVSVLSVQIAAIISKSEV